MDPRLKRLLQGSQRGRAAVGHRERLGRWPNLLRPATFNEKVLYKCVHDRRDFLVQTADKIAVRDYVAGLVGTEVLTDLLAVETNPDRIDFDALPDAFVMKASHGSGWHRVVHDRSRVSEDDLREVARRWLRKRFSPAHKGGCEWWYWEIEPKVLVEGFLGDLAAGTPDDVKLFVFDRQVELVQVDQSRFVDHRRALLTPRWEPLDVTSMYPRPDSPPAPPSQLERMIEIAERLAVDTDFVRVDLYEIGGQVKFGELTHAPHAGCMAFDPTAFDAWLGSRWKQPRSYRT